MANEILENLLREYEHKKVRAELDLEKRKENLYTLLPRLKEIEEDLNSFAIASTKSILMKNDPSTLKELNEKLASLKEEKILLLTSNGYDASYLKPFYECKKCEDTGFIEHNGKKVMCSCLKQCLLDISYNNSNMFNLKSDTFSNFNAEIFSDDVDLSKYGENISPRKNILNIRDKALSFVNHFDDPTSKNLLFTGNTGLRKNFYVELYS